MTTRFSKRPALYFALALFLILIASLLFQLRSKDAETTRAGVAALETEAKRQINDAQILGGLNRNLARSQIEQAKDRFVRAAAKILGADWQKQTGPEARRLQKTWALINQTLANLARKYETGELATFYDFTFLKSGAVISASNLTASTLVALDNQTGTVYTLAITTKSATILTAKDTFKNGQFIDFLGDPADQAFAIWTPDSLIIFPKNTLLQRPAAWGKIVQMRSFSGNLYLLDSEKSQIWKYTPTGEGLSGPKSYLGEGLKLDLSKAVDLAIDGDIYVLTKSGQVAKFSGGNALDFNLTGIDFPLKDPKAIYTSDKTQYIYIFDAGNNRVVVVDKKGNYNAQYLLPSSASGLNGPILADEADKKIFFLSGSKVYSLEIK